MDIRASDAERDATVDRLREAAAEGRLTLEELTDRIEVHLVYERDDLMLDPHHLRRVRDAVAHHLDRFEVLVAYPRAVERLPDEPLLLGLRERRDVIGMLLEPLVDLVRVGERVRRDVLVEAVDERVSRRVLLGPVTFILVACAARLRSR